MSQDNLLYSALKDYFETMRCTPEDWKEWETNAKQALKAYESNRNELEKQNQNLIADKAPIQQGHGEDQPAKNAFLLIFGRENDPHAKNDQASIKMFTAGVCAGKSGEVIVYFKFPKPSTIQPGPTAEEILASHHIVKPFVGRELILAAMEEYAQLRVQEAGKESVSRIAYDNLVWLYEDAKKDLASCQQTGMRWTDEDVSNMVNMTLDQLNITDDNRDAYVRKLLADYSLKLSPTQSKNEKL